MMKTLFVLVTEHNDHGSCSYELQGVTDKKEWAHAFGEIDRFRRGSSADNTVDISIMNVLDAKLLARIEEWLDPVRNPMCACGHRKLHHRDIKLQKNLNHLGGCKHNDPFIHGHQCKRFTKAEEQTPIRFEEPLIKMVTANSLARGWKRYSELFGVVPHGTEKQMAALLELSKSEQKW